MTFLQPAWLLLLPLLLPLLLLLRTRRRRDLTVPSLLVWRTLDPRTVAGARRPTVRWRDRLLWLQAFVAVAVVVAMAQPTLGAAKRTEHAIVVVDPSEAMLAQDVQPDRLGAAISLLRERWGVERHGLLVSVIEAGADASVVAARWATGPDLERALQRITTGGGGPDWAGAAYRAAQLRRQDENVRVVVLTTAGGAERATAALVAEGFDEAQISGIPFGGELLNVGIAGAEITPRGGLPNRWQVEGEVLSSGLQRGDMVRVVAGYRAPASETFLPWGGADVSVGANGRGAFTFPIDLPGPGEVEMRTAGGDQLPTDDRHLLSVGSPPVRIGILGEPHPALVRALEAVGGVELYSVPEGVDAAQLRAFDLLVVGAGSTATPPASALWLGSVPPGVPQGALMTDVQEVRVLPHRLTVDIDPASVGVTAAQPLLLLEGAEPLLTVGDATIGWARTTNLGRQVVLGFGLEESGWASQVGFPAFVARLVEWAVPDLRGSVGAGCRVGLPCPWPSAAFAGVTGIEAPGGQLIPVNAAPRLLVGDPLATAVWQPGLFDLGFVPEMAGRYRLDLPDGHSSVLVNRTPLERSATSEGPSSATSAPVGLRPPPVWLWLAAAALAALALETVLALRARELAAGQVWSLLLVAVSASALLAAAVGVRLPTPRAGGNAVWVSYRAGEGSAPTVPGGPGWSWAFVERHPLRLLAEPGLVRDEGGGAQRVAELPLALELALASPRGAGATRVLFEGTVAERVPLAAARSVIDAASALGVSLEFVPLEAAATTGREPRGARFREVAVQQRVRAGAPFGIVVEIGGVEGAWRVEVTEIAFAPAVRDVAHGPSASGEGGGQARLQLRAGQPGQHWYRLRLIDAGSGELLAETVTDVTVGPAINALLVATDEAAGHGVAAALAAQEFSITRMAPRQLPSSLQGLSVYDLLILVNVAAKEIFPEHQALLERYAREEGGGIVLFGGTSAFGPGGYYSTPLEELSPLSARIEDEMPEVAVAFVIDRSGSMNGPVAGTTRLELTKRAVLEAVSLLGERSLAALIVFDSEADLLLPLTPTSDLGAFRSALASLGAAGGTAIHPGLVAASQLIAEASSATRHVIVMTDGMSQEGDFAEVLDELGGLGVATSFVGVGDADRRQLSVLAGLSGGGLHFASDFRALPGLMAQEALMLAADPVVSEAALGDWRRPEAAPFLAELSAEPAPTVLGFVRTTPKPEASVHLVVGADDEPLLASWRYGLGRVVAFTSEADGRWSEEWLDSPLYARLWSQVGRWVAESTVRDAGTVSVAGQDGVLDVMLELAGPDQSRGPTLPVVELVTRSGVVAARQPLLAAGGERAAARFEIGEEAEGFFEIRIAAAPEIGLSDPFSSVVYWPLNRRATGRYDAMGLAALAAATGGATHAEGAPDLDSVARIWAWSAEPALWLLLALGAFFCALTLRHGLWAGLSGTFSQPARRRR